MRVGNGIEAAGITGSAIDVLTPSTGEAGPELGGLPSALDGSSGHGSGCIDPGCSWVLLTITTGAALTLLLSPRQASARQTEIGSGPSGPDPVPSANRTMCG